MTTRKKATQTPVPAKAPGRRGNSYKGQTFGNGGEITVSIKTFYDLYRKNTDVRTSVQKLSDSVGKGGYHLIDTK